jgi:hypothetical protein
MGRPRTQRTGNPLLLLKYFGPIQQRRYSTYLDFIAILRDPQLREDVIVDDRLFFTITELAFKEYRLPQVWLARKLGVSLVSRWTGEHSPPAYGRPAVVDAIAELMEKGNVPAPEDILLSGVVKRPPSRVRKQPVAAGHDG